jgi:hypothetical protein
MTEGAGGTIIAFEAPMILGTNGRSKRAGDAKVPAAVNLGGKNIRVPWE